MLSLLAIIHPLFISVYFVLSSDILTAYHLLSNGCVHFLHLAARIWVDENVTIIGSLIWFHMLIYVRVLDNLKDYAVRALVNAVDHLGTVAYKLTDLYEQQASEVSTLELKVACLNQVLLFNSGICVDADQELNWHSYCSISSKSSPAKLTRIKKALGSSRWPEPPQDITNITLYRVRTCKKRCNSLLKKLLAPNLTCYFFSMSSALANKRMQAFSEMQTDADIDSRPRPYPSGAISWHSAHN